MINWKNRYRQIKDSVHMMVGAAYKVNITGVWYKFVLISRTEQAGRYKVFYLETGEDIGTLNYNFTSIPGTYETYLITGE